MQNLLLLHLREQKGITVKDIEQKTGIAAAQYMEYEQGTASLSDTDAELLSCFFKVKAGYLKEYAHQLEYFTHCKSILQVKDKRIEELITVLRLYIAGETKPKQKPSKPKKAVSKK